MSTNFEWGAGEMDGSFETLDEQEAYGTTGEASYDQGGYGPQEAAYGEQEAAYGEAEGQYGEVGQYAEGVFDETEETELAADLLSLGSEAEFDQTIGKLIRSAARAVGGSINRDVGTALGGAIKAAAQQTLPMAGAPAGGAPGEIFGIETEGLSGEDQDFEIMRRFVRFAGAASGRAARAPRGMSPRVVARAALVRAARRWAPGLLRRWNNQSRSSAWRARRRQGWPGMRPPVPGYGSPAYPPPYTGVAGMQDGQQPGSSSDPNASAAGFGGAGDSSGAAGMNQGMADSGSGPDSSAGGNGGQIPQAGRWTRQGGQLTIHL